MPTLTDKPATRARAVAKKKRHNSRTSRRNSAPKRDRARKSRAYLSGRRTSPKISRTRLQKLGADLDMTRNAVATAFEDFWIIPQYDLRDTFAKTQKKIEKAVETLQRAA